MLRLRLHRSGGLEEAAGKIAEVPSEVARKCRKAGTFLHVKAGDMGNTFQPSITRFWWLVLGRPCRIDCAQLPPAIVHVTAAGPPGAQCHHLAFIRSRMRQLMNHTQMCNPCSCTSVTYVPGLNPPKAPCHPAF